MSDPILEMRRVSKSFFGIKALRNVDLTVYPGEIHALMGENGAGKSMNRNIQNICQHRQPEPRT